MQIESRNTNTLAPGLYRTLQNHGIMASSRNGPVLRFHEPVMIKLTHPRERVNFCPTRDANPFFHLIEACTVLAGINHIPFLGHFAKQMLQYSDNGETQNAHYGVRLRRHFGFDQLNRIIHNLQNDPNSRQEVALIWDPADLNKETKDKACNVMLMFSINEYTECVMTSINRSNDAIWGGVSGANIVQLSVVHEYVARSIGLPMGPWWHLSNNLHVYVENPKWEKVANETESTDMYQEKHITLVPLFTTPDQRCVFDRELSVAMERMLQAWHFYDGTPSSVDFAGMGGIKLPFVRDALEVFNAWQMYKRGDKHADIASALQNIEADDWRWACQSWIQRHIKS